MLPHNIKGVASSEGRLIVPSGIFFTNNLLSTHFLQKKYKGCERRGGNGDSSVQENNQALEDRERKLKICIKFYIYEETQNL